MANGLPVSSVDTGSTWANACSVVMSDHPDPPQLVDTDDASRCGTVASASENTGIVDSGGATRAARLRSSARLPDSDSPWSSAPTQTGTQPKVPT